MRATAGVGAAVVGGGGRHLLPAKGDGLRREGFLPSQPRSAAAERGQRQAGRSPRLFGSSASF